MESYYKYCTHFTLANYAKIVIMQFIVSFLISLVNVYFELLERLSKSMLLNGVLELKFPSFYFSQRPCYPNGRISDLLLYLGTACFMLFYLFIYRIISDNKTCGLNGGIASRKDADGDLKVQTNNQNILVWEFSTI